MAGGITITEDGFGVNGQGIPVKRYTLKNNNGFCVQVINYGATVTSINLPLKNGKTIDVVLGYDNMQGYLTKDNPYFGSTVGRVANRTKPTKFQLNGKPVCISGNLDENTQLHGGFKGFDKIMWDGKIESSELVMRYCSPDGEEGFPGNLGVTIKFSITADNILKIIFTAVTDKTTIVNLTNHSYFNLAGHNAGADELLKHVLKVEADCYTKLENLVATGELVSVNGTGYDLRTPRPVGDAMKNISEDGFDINYVLKPANNNLKFAAGACYQPLGVTMDVYTTAPGVQLYTSNAIDKIIGKGGSCYKKHSAFCYETQHFPNSANVKSFPSIQLDPGAQYKHEVEYRFTF